jgi:hypothetical protein
MDPCSHFDQGTAPHGPLRDARTSRGRVHGTVAFRRLDLRTRDARRLRRASPRARTSTSCFAADMLPGQDFVVVTTEVTAEDGAARAKTLQASAGPGLSRRASPSPSSARSPPRRLCPCGSSSSAATDVSSPFSDRVVTLTRSFVSTVSVDRRTCDDVTCADAETLRQRRLPPGHLRGQPLRNRVHAGPRDDRRRPRPPRRGARHDCMNGASQACTNVNGFGTCGGTRTCAGNAWGTCTGPAAQAEVDDDADNGL